MAHFETSFNGTYTLFRGMFQFIIVNCGCSVKTDRGFCIEHPLSAH